MRRRKSLAGWAEAELAPGVNALAVLVRRLDFLKFADGDRLGQIASRWPRPTRREREIDYLNHLIANDLVNTNNYVVLKGHARFRTKKAFTKILFVVTRPEMSHLTSSHESLREVCSFDDAVTKMLELRGAVVLGEPGAGKSTTLWTLARRLADDALTGLLRTNPLAHSSWTLDRSRTETRGLHHTRDWLAWD